MSLLSASRNDGILVGFSPSASSHSERPAAQLIGLSRQTLVGLEAGALSDQNASLSYVQEVPHDWLGHALISGSVPKGYAAHLPHLLDEAPVPLVVMAVKEAAANEGVAPKAVLAQRREARKVTGSAPARLVGVTRA